MSPNRQALLNAGWNHAVSEALDENHHTVASAHSLSPEEAFELFLTWNGILGYTTMITQALDNCRNMEAVGQ